MLRIRFNDLKKNPRKYKIVLFLTSLFLFLIIQKRLSLRFGEQCPVADVITAGWYPAGKDARQVSPLFQQENSDGEVPISALTRRDGSGTDRVDRNAAHGASDFDSATGMLS